MLREDGDNTFVIRLIGDSNPKRWESILAAPLDPRHPIRHNIWTAVLEEIQDRAIRESRARVDSSRLYIRNAIDDPHNKPPYGAIVWNARVEQEAAQLPRLVHL